MALAPRAWASLTISSRAESRTLVSKSAYCRTSPLTRFFKAAKISRPMWALKKTPCTLKCSLKVFIPVHQKSLSFAVLSDKILRNYPFLPISFGKNLPGSEQEVTGGVKNIKSCRHGTLHWLLFLHAGLRPPGSSFPIHGPLRYPGSFSGWIDGRF